MLSKEYLIIAVEQILQCLHKGESIYYTITSCYYNGKLWTISSVIIGEFWKVPSTKIVSYKRNVSS